MSEKNGIKPKDYIEENNSAGTKLRERMEEFKMRLGELAVEKIWLSPMKIWSMVWDEFVAADEDALVTVPCSDVVSLATWSKRRFFVMKWMLEE